MNGDSTRRDILKMVAALSVSGLAVSPALAQARGRVVIVGGGFGGATCARYLKAVAPELGVTLVEPSPDIVTCPFSNAVIASLSDISSVTHSLQGLSAAGIEVVPDRVRQIDPDGRTVFLEGGSTLAYDRLVLSPGVDFKTGAIEGYDAAATEVMPHAWKAGPQTTLLRDQLVAMENGGTVVMTIPPNPFRCPPGPYERASLIAHYLKSEKPRSKLILLDAKDSFSKQALFQEAWAALYPDQLEWVPFGEAGNLLRVDPATRTVHTEFASQAGEVVNVIPPQRAADIVRETGLTGGEDWAVVDQTTFESAVAPNIHILGDAVIAGAMPKSGFSAGSQGKICAHVIAALLAEAPLPEPSFINTCYSLVAPDYGISVGDVFRIGEDRTITAVEGAGGVSPLGASAEFRQREADYARGWYASITAEMYG